MVVLWLRKCRYLGPPWNRGEAAFLVVDGQIHYRDQSLARPTGFLPTMFDERNHYSRIVSAARKDQRIIQLYFQGPLNLGRALHKASERIIVENAGNYMSE